MPAERVTPVQRVPKNNQFSPMNALPALTWITTNNVTSNGRPLPVPSAPSAPFDVLGNGAPSARSAVRVNGR